MSKLFASTSVLLLVITFLQHAGVTEAKVQVIHPISLKEEIGEHEDGEIYATMGNFGHLEYGSSILGQVFLPNNNTFGCEPFTEAMFDADAREALFYNKVVVELPVILIDRGECTFVTKTRNVEQVGANVALIGDDRNEHSEDLIMSDDSSGNSISIPSFMIRKEASDALKRASNETLILKISIDIAFSNGTVFYDFWYSQDYDLQEKQLQGFKKELLHLSEVAEAGLRINTVSCLFCEHETKNHNCLSSGRYCPVSPREALPFDLVKATGRQVLEESLRQKCIMLSERSVKSAKQTQENFFNYIESYRSACNTLDKYSKQFCSYETMRSVGIDGEKVFECVENSFETAGDRSSDNVLLKADQELVEQLGVYMNPSMTVNNVTYRGYLDGHDLFLTICQTFVSPKPQACKVQQAEHVDKVIKDGLAKNMTSEEMKKTIQDQLLSANETLTFSDDQFLDRNQTQVFGEQIKRAQHHKMVLWGTFAVVLLIQVLFLVCYRRWQHRRASSRLRFQVDEAVQKYYKVAESESQGEGSKSKSETGDDSQKVDNKHEVFDSIEAANNTVVDEQEYAAKDE